MSVKDMSVRHRLMLLILSSVSLSWMAMFGWSFHSTRLEVTRWDETRLVQLAPLLVQINASDLARLAEHGVDGRNEVPAPNGQTGPDSDYEDRYVRILVTDRDQRIIARSSDFPVVDLKAQGIEHVGKVTVDHSVWLIYTTKNTDLGRTISLMEPANERSDLVSGVAARVAGPTIVLVPILMALAWFSIGIGLQPLAHLSQAVQSRHDRNLQPIEIGSTPNEIRPVISAVNSLLGRLRASLARERTFTADAAHELKTPLTAIKVQAQVAASSRDAAQRTLALERVALGVDRSAHLVEQLLLLARLDDDEMIATSTLQVREIVVEALAFRKHLANEKGMVLKLVGDARTEIQADRVLFRILLDNLLDNAVKYGESAGTVEVELSCHGRRHVLTVRDDGPGVDIEEMARLTDRFFRGRSARASGSGLGLSIVTRIAAQFRANLRFDSGIGGKGLAVSVVFPLVHSAAHDCAIEA
ncbi:ATP-binding protein [Caballeronia glebae]|uniref:ATP-binding protein n=1 Tax=Caballeronia glebae TaxID=1777143 RepID=UPI0038BC8F71